MDKQKIIIQSFGLQHLQPKVFIPPTSVEGINNMLTSYNGLIPQPNTPDTPIARSQLGTPVFDNLVISAGSYTDTTYGLINYPEIIMNSVLITLYQQNNVILTPIQGRDCEVVEYISKMSFRINVKGGIFSSGNIRPTTEIANFKAMIQSNDTLNIGRCGFLDEWNISEIVVLDKNIPQTMGGYNYQLFEFNAIQDVPVILAQKINNA